MFQSAKKNDASDHFPVSGSCALRPDLRRLSSDADSLEFAPLTIRDRQWISPILQAENSLASDGCFGTFFLWGASFGLRVARFHNRLLAKYQSKEISFAYPAGSGDLALAIRRLYALAATENAPLVLRGVNEDQKAKLEDALPGCFTFTEKRDSADYIYDIEKMDTLSGKKLQSKRNHCNRFEQENPDWRFEPMNATHFSSCLALLRSWEEDHSDDADEMQLAEQKAVHDALSHFDELGLVGGMLFAGERPVAFTIGEKVGQNGIDVRFEKADVSVHGAYQMINRQFVRYLRETLPDLQWLNREEDMGHENLRRAKESYYPARLLMKYTAVWTGGSCV